MPSIRVDAKKRKKKRHVPLARSPVVPSLEPVPRRGGWPTQMPIDVGLGNETKVGPPLRNPPWLGARYATPRTDALLVPQVAADYRRSPAGGCRRRLMRFGRKQGGGDARPFHVQKTRTS